MTFTWKPSAINEEIEPRVLTVKFGEGYEQRTPDGINYIEKKWDLKFSVRATDYNAILAYLEARGGVESFLWDIPGGSPERVICRSWRTSNDNLVVRSISATFERVPL